MTRGGRHRHNHLESFKADTTYFEPSTAPLLNLRVADLPPCLKVLREEGCNVLDKVEESDYGKFGVIDPDGKKVESWQPPGGERHSTKACMTVIRRHAILPRCHRARRQPIGVAQLLQRSSQKTAPAFARHHAVADFFQVPSLERGHVFDGYRAGPEFPREPSAVAVNRYSARTAWALVRNTNAFLADSRKSRRMH